MTYPYDRYDVSIISMDYMIAFDKVPHVRLLI